MTTLAPAARRSGPTNERVELARYTISAGARIVYGQRVLGIVRLTDVPADGTGRHYLIERGLTAMAELRAIVEDYVGQAEHWDAVPAEPCWISDRARRWCHDRPRYPDPTERAELDERDLAIARLVGRYVERREHQQPPCAHDLLAAAAEFGDHAANQLRTVLALYEALRVSERA